MVRTKKPKGINWYTEGYHAEIREWVVRDFLTNINARTFADKLYDLGYDRVSFGWDLKRVNQKVSKNCLTID